MYSNEVRQMLPRWTALTLDVLLQGELWNKYPISLINKATGGLKAWHHDEHNIKMERECDDLQNAETQ